MFEWLAMLPMTVLETVGLRELIPLVFYLSAAVGLVSVVVVAISVSIPQPVEWKPWPYSAGVFVIAAGFLPAIACLGAKMDGAFQESPLFRGGGAFFVVQVYIWLSALTFYECHRRKLLRRYLTTAIATLVAAVSVWVLVSFVLLAVSHA